ncbi:hypothetical protein BBK82_14760 [Lentzea guizhouensis]|uniref:Phytanoyl-CoA dioxygenase n=1 Tax=Lentzea guizhouensis TaxID=1586287 RepID=A0A1B2HHE4_9PSEU|nr:phytanoyl-CoA dioxygenase family protein [Lentzea guizhouensis]ANZ37139.1 hypothetical protein BBK82_14760 [Lentzea guizhouensis]
MQSLVTIEHVRQFTEDGFFLLRDVVPPNDLVLLREECDRFVAEREQEMDRLGVDNIDLDHRGRRYFVHAYDRSAVVRRFLLSGLMRDIAQTVLGDTVYLFNEQYVVKAAEQGMSLSWHQDSGYLESDHRPYLTCWITLDDVTEQNGTVYLLPYSRAGTREAVPHVRDEQSRDMVGYSGDDPGDPVIAPAGSIACFASTVLHRSGANTTDRFRRVYLAQYSAEPILNADRSPKHLAEPLTTR